MFGLRFADASPRGSRPPVASGAGEGSGQTQGADVDPERSGDETNATLVSLLPWGVSILFHVGLVLVAIFVIWSTIKQPQVEDRVIPISTVIQETPVLEPLPSEDSKPLTDPRTSNPRAHPRPINHPPTIPDPITGVEGFVVPGDVLNGGADKPGPFDMTPDGGGENGVDFIIKDSAKKIAFVIDASGSLLDSMPFVIENLKEAIRTLKPHQSFTVIFSQGDQAMEVPPRGLQRANEDHKSQALNWVDMDSGNVVPRGRSKPIVAIKAALRYKPEVIFLLSDNITGQGRFETHQKRLLSAVLKANTVKTRINTIQFLYPDPLVSVGLKPTLEVISSATGGKYKFIDGHELGIHW